MNYEIKQDNFPYKEETDLIINAAIEVHKIWVVVFKRLFTKMHFVLSWKTGLFL